MFRIWASKKSPKTIYTRRYVYIYIYIVPVCSLNITVNSKDHWSKAICSTMVGTCIRPHYPPLNVGLCPNSTLKQLRSSKDCMGTHIIGAYVCINVSIGVLGLKFTQSEEQTWSILRARCNRSTCRSGPLGRPERSPV